MSQKSPLRRGRPHPSIARKGAIVAGPTGSVVDGTDVCRATLLDHFARVEEAERRLVARELHDIMGQSSTLLKLLLHRAARAPDEAASLLREAGTIVDELVCWSRNFMLDFQVQALRDDGLVPTLVSLFNRYSARTRVHVNFEHTGVPSGLPFETSIALYRIIQESLVDASRYSGVTELNVRLRAADGSLWLDICGQTKEGDPTANDGGSGFAGVAERVELLGGDLSLDSPAGSGTCVHARLPL